MDYVMVLPVQFYRVGENEVACESAFVKHLQLLKAEISKYSSHIHIASPLMSSDVYEQRKPGLACIDEVNDGITVTGAYQADIGRLKYFFSRMIPVISLLRPVIKNALLVHSGPSSDLFRPFEISSVILGVWYKRPVVFVVDIDERESTAMDRKTGRTSLKSYLLRRFIYDPFFSLQIRFAVKYCSLVLLKSKGLVADYGKGALHVKNFLDVAHNENDIISDESLKNKFEQRKSKPLSLVYFGRLTEYKGIKDMISVVEAVNSKFNLAVQLTIIGGGEQEQELITYAKELGAFVSFKAALQYGDELFNELYQHDILLAAPLREDTPRSVFDAMANGLPTIAYNTYYYCDLEDSGAVTVVPWRDKEAFVEVIKDAANNRERYREMAISGVEFARINTQDHWLNLRSQWLSDCMEENQQSSPVS